ncbi:hypothetical protein COLO4_02478, partial [Corchorus olitorius]
MLGLRDLVALGAQHVGQVAVGFQDAVLPAACTLVAACIQIETHGLARLLGIAALHPARHLAGRRPPERSRHAQHIAEPARIDQARIGRGQAAEAGAADHRARRRLAQALLLHPGHQLLIQKAREGGVGRQFPAACLRAGVVHQHHGRGRDQAVGHEVVDEGGRGHLLCIGIAVEQHQQRLGRLAARRAVGPDIAAVAQHAAGQAVLHQRPLGHARARHHPGLGRRLGQLQHGGALEDIDEAALGRLREGLGIERIALRRGQQGAALLHGRAFDQRHIGRQPVAEPGVVRHAEAGPPDIAAGQMLQRIMVAGRAAEQAHALHARTRLAAPQE